MAKSLKPGDQIPHFQLKDQDNILVDSKQLIGDKALVLFFYPKDDTPGCTAEACAFRDQFEVFVEAGAQVVGISADSPESHKAFALKHRLPYTLLSDDNNQLRKQFGVPKSMFGLLPGRVTYIMDKDGIIRHTFNSQLNVNKHVEEALKVIRSL
jgi:thioredoxin-dependent peroxiredoxin